MDIGYNTLIVLLGTGLLGASAGVVGCFAVLKRRALLGDALSHAALPGVCIAFLIVQERHLPSLLLGALVSGLLGMLCITALKFFTRIKDDAALGIILSVFYGGGIVLSQYIQHRSATGSKAGLESFILGKTAGMIREDVILIAWVAAFCLAVTLLIYKELKLVTFDHEYAISLGRPAFWFDLLILSMIAITVVIGLPAVGIVLMAALIIIPPATARLWSQTLGSMMIIAVVVGAASGATGTLLSRMSEQHKLSTGPAIVLSGAVFFFVSLLIAPQRGILARAIRHWRNRLELADAKRARQIVLAIDPQLLPNIENWDREEIANHLTKEQHAIFLEKWIEFDSRPASGGRS